MKKEYIAPCVCIEDIEPDSIMIQFSLMVGGDDGGGGAGAKEINFQFYDCEEEEEEEEPYAPLTFSGYKIK